jgi:hypothetical protein
MIIVILMLILMYMAFKSEIWKMFDPQFYIAQPVDIKIYSGIGELPLPPANKIYKEAPAKYTYQSKPQDADIIIQNFYKGESVRFVANMLESTVILMAPNEFSVQDLSDLKNVESAVIGANNPEAVTVMQDLLAEYPDVSGIKVKVSTEITNEKPLMYAFVTRHPSKEIANLVKSQPMHVVTMNKINNGNYFVSDSEKPFYRKHEIYQKASFDMHKDGVKYYPGLSIRGQLLYYPTIKFYYSIYARADFPAVAVERLLDELLLKTRMPLADVAYNPDKSVETHDGARRVYFRKSIYTTEPRPEIWQGF